MSEKNHNKVKTVQLWDYCRWQCHPIAKGASWWDVRLSEVQKIRVRQFRISFPINILVKGKTCILNILKCGHVREQQLTSSFFSFFNIYITLGVTCAYWQMGKCVYHFLKQVGICYFKKLQGQSCLFSQTRRICLWDSLKWNQHWNGMGSCPADAGEKLFRIYAMLTPNPHCF